MERRLSSPAKRTTRRLIPPQPPHDAGGGCRFTRRVSASLRLLFDQTEDCHLLHAEDPPVAKAPQYIANGFQTPEQSGSNSSTGVIHRQLQFALHAAALPCAARACLPLQRRHG
jgi:hypothetical protein